MAKKVTGEDGKVYKVKKPFYKKVWFWIVIVLLFGAVGSSINKKDGNNNTSNTSAAKNSNSNSSKDTSNSNTKVSSSEPEKTYTIGEIVKVGDMEYTVNSKETTNQVGPSIAPTSSKDTFLVVDLTVTNKSKKAVTVDSSFFKLIDGDKEFDADAAASLSANQGEDGTVTNSFFLESLNPDVTMSGKIVFDVSNAQATSTSNQLRVQTGAWGTEKDLINLN